MGAPACDKPGHFHVKTCPFHQPDNALFLPLLETYIMQNTSNYLKTAEQYNSEVKSWALKVRGISVNILVGGTHSSGALRKQLRARPRMDKEKVYINALGFVFNRYGVYRAYGAGRGYVVDNGVIRRGYRLYNSQKKTWVNTDLRESYRRKGYEYKELRKKKIFGEPDSVPRSPLNWLDAPIEKNINDLGDIAGEYHGDQALRDVLQQLYKITIKKQYGKK